MWESYRPVLRQYSQSSPDWERFRKEDIENVVIGVPKEIKKDEYRVALVPSGVAQFRKAGHTVLVQTGRGPFSLRSR